MDTIDKLKLAVAAQGVPPEVIDTAFDFVTEYGALTMEEKRSKIVAMKAAAVRDLSMVGAESADGADEIERCLKLRGRLLDEIEALLEDEESDEAEPSNAPPETSGGNPPAAA